MARSDLKFIESKTHRRIVASLLAECEVDRECVGVLLEGSLARGDASPHSDIDLRVILVAGAKRAFHSEVRSGIRLEVRYADFARARSKLAETPMDV